MMIGTHTISCGALIYAVFVCMRAHKRDSVQERERERDLDVCETERVCVCANALAQER